MCFENSLIDLSSCNFYNLGEDKQTVLSTPNSGDSHPLSEFIFTNCLRGSKIIQDLLTNPNLNFNKFYFVSFNFHIDRTIQNRGKPKLWSKCTQEQQYNYFKEKIIRMPFDSDMIFNYTFYEQNYQGKIHFHQFIYYDGSIWNYQAKMYDHFECTKKEITERTCHIRDIDDADELYQYIFNKKSKAYEIINQEKFKPQLLFKFGNFNIK